MKTRILSFIAALREAGLAVTVADSLDAMRAVAAVGVEREPFREALAATLVKDEAVRPTFEATFERCFALPERRRPRRPRSTRHGEGAAAGRGHDAGAPAQRQPSESPQAARRGATSEHPATHGQRLAPTAERLHHRRMLRRVPFHEMDPLQVEACAQLLAELAERFRARLSRRQRAARRGRLDVRRTIRRSISSGGVPLEPAFRRRQPGRSDLVALCDMSHSVATAANFLLGLIAPARPFFRRVRLFGFVDCPVELSIERGQVVPHGTLDLYARSDFGKVLVTLWRDYESLVTRNTVLLILGDARNNRRPPRADVLARMRGSAKRVIWLNPEPRPRWNTGDSALSAYTPHCDELLAATSPCELEDALQHAFRNV